MSTIDTLSQSALSGLSSACKSGVTVATEVAKALEVVGRYALPKVWSTACSAWKTWGDIRDGGITLTEGYWEQWTEHRPDGRP